MSVFPLLVNVKATQGVPGPGSPPQQIVNPPPPSAGTGSPVVNLGVQVVVASPWAQTSVGSEVVMVASNDASNWTTLTTVTCAAATPPTSTIISIVAPYQFYGAYCKTLTGSTPTLTATLSA